MAQTFSVKHGQGRYVENTTNVFPQALSGPIPILRNPGSGYNKPIIDFRWMGRAEAYYRRNLFPQLIELL